MAKFMGHWDKIWRARHNNLWYFISRLVDLNDGLWDGFDVQKFATNNFLKQIGIFHCFF